MRLDARHVALAGTFLVLGSGCVRPVRLAAMPLPGGPGEDLAADEAWPAGEPGLDAMIRLALAHNPGLQAARARALARAAGVAPAGRWPDLEVSYELWAAPLAHPWDMTEAEGHMIELRQMIPAPGTLDARSRAELAEAQLAVEEQRAAEQDVVRDVRNAYHILHLAEREQTIRRDHAALLERIVEVARAGYEAGWGSQQEILQLAVEETRLRGEVVAVEQKIDSTRALLNTLMGRPVDAPIGPLPEPARDDAADRATSPVDERRPEIAAAGRAIQAAEARLDEARQAARWPSFMLAADYMYMPMADEPQRFGFMVAINLPWLNPARSEQVGRVEKDVRAARLALASTRAAARYQARDAETRVTAARKIHDLVDRELVPRARQSFEATLAAYTAGRGNALALLDAQRALLDVELERLRSQAELAIGLADLERATGGSAAKGTEP